MESELHEGCVNFYIKNDFEFGYKHEIVNALLCIALLFYISYKPSLRNCYKFDLLPLLLLQLMESSAYACFFSIPFAACYYPRTWRMSTLLILMQIGFVSKPFLILHSLIRPPLHSRFSILGLFASICIPFALALIPALEIIFRFDVVSSTITCINIVMNGLINLAVSVYFIRSGRTFPIISAVYEGLFAIPDCLKYTVGAHLHIEHFKTIDYNDDFAFFFTVLVCICVLAWKNRNELKLAQPEFKSFDNHNVIV